MKVCVLNLRGAQPVLSPCSGIRAARSSSLRSHLLLVLPTFRPPALSTLSLTIPEKPPFPCLFICDYCHCFEFLSKRTRSFSSSFSKNLLSMNSVSAVPINHYSSIKPRGINQSEFLRILHLTCFWGDKKEKNGKCLSIKRCACLKPIMEKRKNRDDG